jgi:hypothetical protein
MRQTSRSLGKRDSIVRPSGKSIPTGQVPDDDKLTRGLAAFVGDTLSRLSIYRIRAMIQNEPSRSRILRYSGIPTRRYKTDSSHAGPIIIN